MTKRKTVPSIVLICMAALSLCCTKKENYDLVVKNVKLFNGYRVFDKSNIYVKDGIIAKIDTSGGDIQCDFKCLVDGTDLTVIPGLINSHTHPQSRNDLKTAAQAGILTMMDLLRIVEDSIRIFKSLGNTPEYASYYTSGIGADMPNAVIHQYIQDVNPWAITSPNDIKPFIAERIKSQVDFIKVFQDSRLPEKFDDTLFKGIVEETHANKLLTIVHAEVLRDARYAFKNGADILAHGWVDSVVSDLEIATWKKRDFYVIPTLLVHTTFKKEKNPASYTLSEQQMLEEVRRLNQAGVTLIAGSDSPADNLNFSTDFYKELELYVKAGIKPIDVLKTATSNPAKAFRLKGKGELKEGNSADFVLVEGDPVNNISALYSISAVWKKGVKIK